jgi:polar amino acid transport system substrate-binding protein
MFLLEKFLSKVPLLRKALLRVFFFCALSLSLLLAFSEVYSQANQKVERASAPKTSDVLEMAVGLALPPYNIMETHDGVELDIVKEALAYNGYQMKPVYVPLARLSGLIDSGEVDGALTLSPDLGIDSIFLSDVHIIYQNVAVSLKERELNINSAVDLEGHSIIAFQNASLYLGEEFAQIASNNRNYVEMFDQESQVKMLFSKRADVVVIDINIFNYYLKRLKGPQFLEEINVHRIFEVNPYRVGFKDEKIMKDFNEGLEFLRESGRYPEILGKYFIYR